MRYECTCRRCCDVVSKDWGGLLWAGERQVIFRFRQYSQVGVWPIRPRQRRFQAESHRESRVVLCFFEIFASSEGPSRQIRPSIGRVQTCLFHTRGMSTWWICYTSGSRNLTAMSEFWTEARVIAVCAHVHCILAKRFLWWLYEHVGSLYWCRLCRRSCLKWTGNCS